MIPDAGPVPPSLAPDRSWPLLVIGGGPAAALQVHGSGMAPTAVAVVAESFGGGMGFLGDETLQSYAEELTVGLPVDDLRRRMLPMQLRPSGRVYHKHVQDALMRSGATLIEGRVADIEPDPAGIAVRILDADDRPFTLRATAVVLATGTEARPAPPGLGPTTTFDRVTTDLLAGRTGPYRDRSVLVVGAGNSALQVAGLLGSVARDVTILGNRYLGVYPQETDDRFAWRAPSQLTCEIITKSAQRCRNAPRFVPCIRFIVYDDLRSVDGDLVFTYSRHRNDHPLGRASLPPRCPHLLERYMPLPGDRWSEHRGPGTVVVWATGVRPKYPPGAFVAGLARRADGYVLADEQGRTAAPGLYVAGACAGYRSVNEMRAVVVADEIGPRPAGFRLRRRQPSGATSWLAAFEGSGPC